MELLVQKSCHNNTCKGKPFRKLNGEGDYYCSGCLTYYKNHGFMPKRKNCIKCGNLLQQRRASNSDYCMKCAIGVACSVEGCLGRVGRASVGGYCYTHQKDRMSGTSFRDVTHQGGKGGCYQHGNPVPCMLCRKDRHLMREYGISLAQFTEMLESQNSKCAFPDCSTDIASGGRGTLYVDHDHKTGKIRSLICYRHNFLLGNAQDDISQLKHAIQYLKDHGIS